MSLCCSKKSVTNSSQSFFYNSTSQTCSKKEVITLVVLGSLAILMATAALYGYLADSSWLVGAHVLTGTTFFALAIAGSLVLTKCLKSCLAQRALSNASLSQKGAENEVPRGYWHVTRSFATIFDTREYVIRDTAPHSTQETEQMQGWFEGTKKPYFVGNDKNGRLFALIDCRDQEGRSATILIGPAEKGPNYHISYLHCDDGFAPPRFEDEAHFGHPNDVLFFTNLVREGKWRDQYFLGEKGGGAIDEGRETTIIGDAKLHREGVSCGEGDGAPRDDDEEFLRL